MHPELARACAVLERTPRVLDDLLRGLPDELLRTAPASDSWSAFDVLGHLIHGERSDWIPRARVILARGDSLRFEPFDRFAQLAANRGRGGDELLAEFAELRRQNLETLRSWKLGDQQLGLPGEHPELGPVDLSQLIATWVVHDLGHLAQIERALASAWRERVGPWRAYLPVLERR